MAASKQLFGRPQSSTSLLKLLDEMYVGGLPSAKPERGMDQMKIPGRSALPPKKIRLPEDEEEDESVLPPKNIMGQF